MADYKRVALGTGGIVLGFLITIISVIFVEVADGSVLPPLPDALSFLIIPLGAFLSVYGGVKLYRKPREVV